LDFYACNATFRVKADTQSDFTRTFENQILPLLDNEKGFKEAITRCSPGPAEEVSTSLVGAQRQCR
jgi:hypothetical protein